MMSQLRRDRNVHMRELKRIEDENESKYTPGMIGKDMMGEVSDVLGIGYAHVHLFTG
jgi:hypothetical protein